MKKSLLFILLAAITACQSGSKINQKKPDQVVLGFIRHIGMLEIDKAQELSMGETKQMLGMMSQMMSGSMSEEERQKAIDEAAEELKSIKKADCDVVGEEASCRICCDPNGKWSEEDMTLTRVDGKWYVNMPMSKEGGAPPGMGSGTMD